VNLRPAATHRTFKVSALDKLNTLAGQLSESDPSLTEAQAFAKVYGDPNNRDLVRQEYADRMAKVARAS